MNFSSMEYYSVLAQERNFTRAAERLHREFPKVCVNLYTDVRYTYQYGGFIYG